MKSDMISHACLNTTINPSPNAYIVNMNRQPIHMGEKGGQWQFKTLQAFQNANKSRRAWGSTIPFFEEWWFW